MMTSIPYEKGWSVKVDGVKQDIIAIKDALVGVELTAGEHTIELSYIPAGFIAGTAISVISLAGLIALYYILKKREKRSKVLIEQGINTELVDAVIENYPEEQPAVEVEEQSDNKEE